jgi:hypothetical protein
LPWFYRCRWRHRLPRLFWCPHPCLHHNNTKVLQRYHITKLDCSELHVVNWIHLAVINPLRVFMSCHFHLLRSGRKFPPFERSVSVSLAIYTTTKRGVNWCRWRHRFLRGVGVGWGGC